MALALCACRYDAWLGGANREPLGVAGAPTDPLDAPLEPGRAPLDATVVVEVRTDVARAPISPLIYGERRERFAERTAATMTRLASIRWETYNWENNGSNAGPDVSFQNDGYLSASKEPGAALRAAVESARKAGQALTVVIPVGDLVAADRLGDGDVRNTDSFLSVRFRRNEELLPGPLPTADTSDSYVHQQEAVTWLRTQAADVRLLFALSDEPDLWTQRLPMLRDQPLRYAELVSKNLEFARAVRLAWPDAELIGLGAQGWPGFRRLEDRVTGQQPDDARGREFIDFYLSQLESSGACAERLIQHVDLHWYSEATDSRGYRIIDSQDAVTADERVQAPRSLWDERYVERSWITRDATRGEPIRLFADVQRRIRGKCPTADLAIGAWDFGGADHISGALAGADALGAFGRFGIGYGARVVHDGAFDGLALDAYRNFDGRGARFGDRAIDAQSSDRARLTSWASLDDANRPVIVLVHKAHQATVVGLRLWLPETLTRARRFQLDESAPRFVAGAPVSLEDNVLRVELPPMSLTVLDLE